MVYVVWSSDHLQPEDICALEAVQGAREHRTEHSS
jgi:hypothetical protein